MTRKRATGILPSPSPSVSPSVALEARTKKLSRHFLAVPLSLGLALVGLASVPIAGHPARGSPHKLNILAASEAPFDRPAAGFLFGHNLDPKCRLNCNSAGMPAKSNSLVAARGFWQNQPVSDRLHSCPDCGAQISRRAAACPHCGAPSAVAPPTVAPPVVVARSGVGDGARIGLGLLLVGIVFGVIFFSFGEMESDERRVMLVIGFLIFVVAFFGFVRKGKKAMERDRTSVNK